MVFNQNNRRKAIIQYIYLVLVSVISNVKEVQVCPRRKVVVKKQLHQFCCRNVARIQIVHCSC